MHSPERHVALLGHGLAGAFHLRAVLDEHRQCAGGLGACGRHALGSEVPLDLVEVEAQPEDLGEPAASSDDLDEPVRQGTPEVAGPQLTQFGALGEVSRCARVAHHHVGPGVDKLADRRVGHVVDRLEAQTAAGDRDADRRRMALGEHGREVSHPGGGLGLPVHDEEVPAAPLPQLQVLRDPLGCKLAAGLGDVAEPGQLPVGEPGGVEQVEGVWHSGESGDAVPLHQDPEALVDDGQLGDDHARSDREVAVEHRQSVAVVQRQVEHAAIGVAEVEVGRDRLGVGRHVAVRQAHESG